MANLLIINGSCFLFLLQQFTAPGFGNRFHLIRAMPAPIATAMAFFEMVFFCEHHVTMLVVVIINSFNQRLAHVIIVLIFDLWLMAILC